MKPRLGVTLLAILLPQPPLFEGRLGWCFRAAWHSPWGHSWILSVPLCGRFAKFLHSSYFPCQGPVLDSQPPLDSQYPSPLVSGLQPVEGLQIPGKPLTELNTSYWLGGALPLSFRDPKPNCKCKCSPHVALHSLSGGPKKQKLCPGGDGSVRVSGVSMRAWVQFCFFLNPFCR